MSFIAGNSISLEQLILKENLTTSKLNTENDYLYFTNSQNIQYKLNNDCIYVDSTNKVGICTTTPQAQLDIQSENTQLRLSNNTTQYSDLKIDSDNILNINGQTDINVNNSKIINITAPVNNSDCATKEYVDNKLICTSVNLLDELCKIYNFNPLENNLTEDIINQITLRNQFKIPLKTLLIAVSPELVPMCYNTVTFKVPFSMLLTEVRASLTKPAVGCTGVKFNIIYCEGIQQLFTCDFYIPPQSTCAKMTISDTTWNVINNVINDNEELTIKVTEIGNLYSGAGLKLTFIGL